MMKYLFQKRERAFTNPASLALFVIEYASTLADPLIVSLWLRLWCYFTHETWLVCCSNQEKEYFLHNLFAAMLVLSE